MLRRLVSRALLVTLLGVAGGIVATSGPATAAACEQGTGVTAVVDFHELGGGARSVCVPGGGGYADSIFGQAGIGMTYASQEPGFVCRVEGAPASAPCARASSASAYWSLWWSDGKSGTWSYASSGVGGLKLKAGSFVAWSWQKGSGRSVPGVSPVGKAAAPAPTKPKAKPKPSRTGSSQDSAVPKPSPSPSTAAQKAKAKKVAAKKKAAAKVSATPSPTAASDEPATDEQVENASNESSGSGSLAWVAGGLGLLLLVGMGLAVWQRRAQVGRQS